MLKALKQHLTKPVTRYALLSVLCGVLLYCFSSIDVAITSLFYDPSKGGFYLKPHPLLMLVHNGVGWVVGGMLVVYILLMLINTIAKRPVLGRLTNWGLLYLILAILMGPGFVVNTVLKDHVGRARPVQIQEFGGDKIFTPPFVISDQCERNCSFVSGDPSVGFVLFVFGMLYGRKFFWIASLVGGGIGAVRIMQGAHFFSDVVFSGIFTFWVCYLLYHAMAACLKHRRFIQLLP